MSCKTVARWWRKKQYRMFLKGKVSWLRFDRIECQSILSSLIRSKKYMRGLLLDVGCGDKPYTPVFYGSVSEYIGLDLHVIEQKPDVRGSALALPFKPESFDTVLSTQVLTCVPEPKQMLHEIYRVLKGKRYLILTASVFWSWDETEHEYYCFTKYGLRYLAESVGFKVIYIEARTGFWGMLGQKLSSYFFYTNNPPKSMISIVTKSCICAIIQMFFHFLDRIQRIETESFGYIMVALKQ